MATLGHARAAPERSFERSAELYAAARHIIAGGVTSAVRAGELPQPLYFDHGIGPRIWDGDGNGYVDYALGYGPLILGHSFEPIRRDEIDSTVAAAATAAAEVFA